MTETKYKWWLYIYKICCQHCIETQNTLIQKSFNKVLSDDGFCQKFVYVRWLRCHHSKTMNLTILVWTLVFQFRSIFAKKGSGCLPQWGIIGIMGALGPPLPIPSYPPTPPPLLVQIVYSTKCSIM